MRTRAALLLESSLLLAALAAASRLAAVARHPQAHEQALYRAGGARRLVQVVATDLLGSHGIAALSALALLACLATLPRRHPTVARQGRQLIAWISHTSRRELSRWLEHPSLRQLVVWISHTTPRHPLRSLALLVFLVLAPLSFLLCRTRPTPPPLLPLSAKSERGPGGEVSLLVLVADSLPLRRLTPAVAPHLTALASQSLRFDRAVSVSPAFEPAWASLLTGRTPHHDHHDGAHGDHPAPLDDTWLDRLARSGYTTALVQAPTDREVVDRTRAALASSAGRPFAIVARLTTSRPPWASPEPFYRRFTDPSYRGRFKYQRPPLAPGDPPLDDADRAQLTALHDGAIAAVDAAAGQILADLAHRGLDRSTLVVVTATRGEPSLDTVPGDLPLDEDTLAVPLILHDGAHSPAPRAVPDRVSTIDLAPTLLALARVPAPDDLDGRSLAPLLSGSSLRPSIAFSRSPLRSPTGLPQLAARTDDRALWLRPTRQGFSSLLCATAVDPTCQHDLTATEPDTASRLRSSLLDWALGDARLERLGDHLVPRTLSAELLGPAPPPLALQLTPPAGPRSHHVTLLLDQLDRARWQTPARRRGLADEAPDHQRDLADGECVTPAPHLRASVDWPEAVGRVTLASDRGQDARESLVVAPPTRVFFPLTVPAGARLSLALARLGARVGTVSFAVDALLPDHSRRPLDRWTLAPSDGSRWHERTVDLTPLAGQDIELELSTDAVDLPADAPPASLPVAAWGSPAMLTPHGPELPYNIILLVDDALPGRDALTAAGVSFPDLTPAATWERPELLALLAGARPDQLGVATALRILPATTQATFEASSPPLLPRLLRPFGVRPHAIVPDGQLLGGGGFEAGFVSVERIADPRHAADAVQSWLDRHRDERTVLFVQLPPGLRRDILTGQLVAHGRPPYTVIAALSDPWASPWPASSARCERLPASTGEPARAGTKAASLTLLLPGDRAAGEVRPDAVTTIDVAPTLLAIEGLTPPPAMRGRSLLARGENADPRRAQEAGDSPRALVTTGCGERRVRLDGASLTEHDDEHGPTDTGNHLPDDVARRLRERLGEELAASAATDVQASAARAATRLPAIEARTSRLEVRFAGAGASRRVTLSAHLLPDATGAATPLLQARVIEGDPAALRLDATSLDLTLVTRPDALVGLDIEVSPSATPIAWELQLDDQPLPPGLMHALGLAWEPLRAGLLDASSRRLVTARTAVGVDPSRDLGVFVRRHPSPDLVSVPADQFSCFMRDSRAD